MTNSKANLSVVTQTVCAMQQIYTIIKCDLILQMCNNYEFNLCVLVVEEGGVRSGCSWRQAPRKMAGQTANAKE